MFPKFPFCSWNMILTLYTQEEAEIYFVYKNLGNKELKINNIKSSCGCTIPS